MASDRRYLWSRWPLWQAALLGAAVAIAYGISELWRGVPIPEEIHPDAHFYFLAGQWAARAAIFAAFFVIVAAARNYILAKSSK